MTFHHYEVLILKQHIIFIHLNTLKNNAEVISILHRQGLNLSLFFSMGWLKCDLVNHEVYIFKVTDKMKQYVHSYVCPSHI